MRPDVGSAQPEFGVWLKNRLATLLLSFFFSFLKPVNLVSQLSPFFKSA